MLRLIAVVGAVPAVGIAIGYRMRAVQASENQQEGSRTYKSCDLPLYPTSNPQKDQSLDPPYPRNALEKQIGVARRSVQAFCADHKETFNTVTSPFRTGYEHTAATLDYIQNDPSELPRVVFIAVAGLGGVVLGYRGGVLRKMTYGTIAAASAASLAYPKASVDLSQEVSTEVKGLWKEFGGEDLVKEIKGWSPFSKD